MGPTMKLDSPPFSRVSLSLPVKSEPALVKLGDQPSLIQLRSPTERRPSRFEVIRAPDAFTVQHQLQITEHTAAGSANFSENDDVFPCRFPLCSKLTLKHLTDYHRRLWSEEIDSQANQLSDVQRGKRPAAANALLDRHRCREQQNPTGNRRHRPEVVHDIRRCVISVRQRRIDTDKSKLRQESHSGIRHH